ncbi:non-histone chromosomal protein 6 homolog [Nylanderia fulva]|uniref:non-histone chromosomal protein 6 homolog n=1 Tax=Nylanderia fulva TaxID=613905 RepID=UPI0010FB900A|nr:non-histone chromosomal protein 6 homolog [Nylanderia fulva]
MGNASSAQSSKTQKDSKKENHGCADTRKDRRLGNGKAVGQNSRDKHDIRTTNPFLIFFLRLRSKKPKEHVTVIARAAGKLWARMTPEQRKKYVDLANEEKRRRQERKHKRKRLSTRSR